MGDAYIVCSLILNKTYFAGKILASFSKSAEITTVM